MSLVPTYIYEEGTELPDKGTYFVVAANGMFMHKDVGTVRALIRFELGNVPLLKNFEPPSRKSMPVYVYDDDCGELPENENYFVIAKNGVHECDESGKSSIVSFNDIPNLGTLKTHVHFELPKIPGDIIWRCLLFFRRVWYVYKSEAAIILFYNAKTHAYHLHCPKQQVSGGGVDYGTSNGQADPDEARFISEMRQQGFNRVGTIHSHCDFGAFHSSIDTGDEAEWPDGIHITIGNVDGKHFSLVASLVVNNNRFKVNPVTVIDSLARRHSRGESDIYYDVTLGNEDKEALIGLHQHEIEEEWLPKVSYRQFTNKNNYEQSKNWLPHGTSSTSSIYGANLVEYSETNDSCLDPEEIPNEPITGWQYPLSKDYLETVRRNALVLLPYYKDGNIPNDKKWRLSVLRDFFRKQEIYYGDILAAAKINSQYPEYYKKKGYAIS